MTIRIEPERTAHSPSVLHVVASMDPRLGGVSQGILQLVPLLKSAGSRNEVVCLDDPLTPGPMGTDFPLHRLGRPDNPWQYSRRLIPWLRDRASGFDAVVVHGMWLYHGMATAGWVERQRSAAGCRAPIFLVMPHGMLDPWFQEAPERRLKSIRNSVYWRLVERRVVETADAILFTSGEEMRRARTSFPGYRPRMERVVGFGTAEPPKITSLGAGYPHSELPIPGREGYLLYLGRIHEKKGVGMLLEAYAGLREASLPSLLVAGPGWDSAYGRSLLDAIDRDAFLKAKVHPEGMLSGDRKWQALMGCEAFVLPSHHENFGVAVAEALSCGRPVLLSDKVNIHREIVDSGAGLSADDSVQGVASLLTRWNAMDASCRGRMSRAALQVHKELFRMSLCAERFLEVCLDLSAVQVVSPGRSLEGSSRGNRSVN